MPNYNNGKKNLKNTSIDLGGNFHVMNTLKAKTFMAADGTVINFKDTNDTLDKITNNFLDIRSTTRSELDKINSLSEKKSKQDELDSKINELIKKFEDIKKTLVKKEDVLALSNQINELKNSTVTTTKINELKKKIDDLSTQTSNKTYTIGINNEQLNFGYFESTEPKSSGLGNARITNKNNYAFLHDDDGNTIIN